MLLSVRTWLFQQLAQGSGHRLRRYWSSRAGRQGRADHLQDHLHTQNVLVLSYFRASNGPPFTRPLRVMTNSGPYSTDLFSSHTDAEFSSIQSQRDQSPVPVDPYASLSLFTPVQPASTSMLSSRVTVFFFASCFLSFATPQLQISLFLYGLYGKQLHHKKQCKWSLLLDVLLK